jgi:hypothetical protein
MDGQVVDGARRQDALAVIERTRTVQQDARVRSMTISEDAEDFIVAQWHAAMADAGLDDADVHLVVCAGAAVSGPPKGVSYNRGDELTGALDADGIVVTAEKIAEANAPENLSRYRVAVLEDIDPDDPSEVAFLAAVMRHELEHCKQWEAGSKAHKLYGLVDQVIQLVCGDDQARAGELINTQPIEGDANAASSAYLRRRYPEAIPALAAREDHFLADWIDPPGRPEQLVERTVAFLHEFADICNDPEGLPVDTTFADILDRRLAGSGDIWRQLDAGN